MADLESVWEHREEVVYPSLFGAIGEGLYALSPETFIDGFGFTEIDPHWGHYGVFESQPNEKRSTWLYVTSGMSNPWDTEPADYATSERSGLGVEFVLETTAQSRWAIVLLHRMIAYNLLLSIGKFGDKPTLGYGNRIATDSSVIIGQESDLTAIAIVHPDHYPSTFRLDSGSVDLLQFIAITAAEVEYAKTDGVDALVERLKTSGSYPAVDPLRKSIV